MIRKPFSPGGLVSYFSYHPHDISIDLKRVCKQAKPSSVQRYPDGPPGGLFNDLPIELLHLIFSMLDPRSLSRVSRVSLQGKAIVEVLPSYRDLWRHVPGISGELSEIGIPSLHSVATLHAALMSQSCVSCGEYGPFLFLISAERCCVECLKMNPALWVIPVSTARRIFVLTSDQFGQLPIIKSAVRHYDSRHSFPRRKALNIVSVRDAKELAMRKHGSTENLARACHLRTPKPRAKVGERNRYYLINVLHGAPLQPSHRVPLTSNKIPDDHYRGMASIAFPTLLPNNVLESGRLCRGCKWTYDAYQSRELSYNITSQLVPTGTNPNLEFRAMKDHVMSGTSFLQHFRDCYGLPRVVTKDVELRKISKQVAASIWS